jgi:hypothetical protein
MLGKMIQVTDGCDFVGKLKTALVKEPLEVLEVYWEENGKVAVGVAPTDHEPSTAGDGLWCVIYPGECEIVEDSE